MYNELYTCYVISIKKCNVLYLIIFFHYLKKHDSNFFTQKCLKEFLFQLLNLVLI